MNKNILYLTDDYLYLYDYKLKKIIKEKLSKQIIINGKIANLNKFIEKYENMMKEHNLNRGLFGDKIKIIVHPLYTDLDMSVLKNIFYKLNYRNVIIEKESKYYKLYKNNAWLNILSNYLILGFIDDYNKKQYLFIPNNYFEQFNDLADFIKMKINKRDLYLFGSSTLIDNFMNDFEKKWGNITYLLQNHETYLLNCIINM